MWVGGAQAKTVREGYAVPNAPQIFLSYTSEDALVADLLTFCIERLLSDIHVNVWNYQSDQPGYERNIAASIPERVKESSALIFLVSRSTLQNGSTQWMELAYADVYKVPTFVLLKDITFPDLWSYSHVPPPIVSGQCTQAIEWQSLEPDFRRCCSTDSSEREV